MKSQNSLPFVIYLIGMLIGLTLVIIATWADVESAFYGFSRRASTPFNGLRCPILMTANETRSVSATIRNTTDRLLSPSVKTELSTRSLPIETLESIRLTPGESKKLEWTVGPDNIDLGQFIFFKVLVFASYPLPDRETTCGILILDLPISGNVIIFASILISLPGMGYGLYLLSQSKLQTSRNARAVRPFTFLAGVIVLGLICSFMGWWIQGIGVLVFALLTILVTINSLLFKAE